MKKSSSRSLLMWPLLATCLTLSAYGQRPSLEMNDAAGRAPVATYTPASRIPIVTTNPADDKKPFYNFWDALAATDDYNFSVTAGTLASPNPDIAVGPSDILVVVGQQIARYPNQTSLVSGVQDAYRITKPWSLPPNSLGPQPTSKTWLATWIGEEYLAYACPTTPRTPQSCIIDNASVRYDQMQGRFVVLFTIVDTQARLAHWALLVSKWADFGTTYGTGNTMEVFTTPQPPGPNQGNPSSGSPNSNWLAYLNTGTNINLIRQSLIDRTTAENLQNGGVTATVDCTPGAIAAPGVTPTTFCYMPTGARLGIDNDNLIVTASVINDNINVVDRSQANPAYAGTRLRVIKKNGLYRLTSALGGLLHPNHAGDSVGQVQNHYYDLYPLTPSAVGSAAWNAAYRNNPYTVDPHLRSNLQGATLFYEPTHVRGRALATYTGNANIGPCQGGPGNQYPCMPPNAAGQGTTQLVGAFTGSGSFNTNLTLRTIVYSRMFAGSPASPSLNPPAIADGVVIAGGIPSLINNPYPEYLTVQPYSDPALVTQRDRLAGAATTPQLYVGDARPHRVIAREGHLYVARVANTFFSSNTNFDRSSLNTTVLYDVIQKLNWQQQSTSILNTKWVNGSYFQPMFDVTPNVIQYGSVSPISIVSYLDKLFVGTTFPPLAPTDTRTQANGGISPYLTTDLVSICKGQEPGVTLPSNPPLPTPTAGTRAYLGLFDVRCGEDAYDTSQQLRDPVTGRVISSPPNAQGPLVPWGIRGGASIDPNNGTLWIYGSYAAGRLAQIPGAGQWATHIANYDMSFPETDMYGNKSLAYNDVDKTHPFYRFIQIAKQTSVAPGSRTDLTFSPDAPVLRKDMAAWVVRAQMDETAVDNYLLATGGANYSSFADVEVTFASGPDKGKANPAYRYIETMYRRGYTKGCSATNDGVRRFCPDASLTRGQMAVFLIRAKMNSVFPTVVSGSQTSPNAGSFGDLYGQSYSSTPYFTDVPASHDFFGYIQKMRELRISNGTTAAVTDPVTGKLITAGAYDPEGTLTKGQIAAFIIRAFMF